MRAAGLSFDTPAAESGPGTARFLILITPAGAPTPPGERPQHPVRRLPWREGGHRAQPADAIRGHLHRRRPSGAHRDQDRPRSNTEGPPGRLTRGPRPIRAAGRPTGPSSRSAGPGTRANIDEFTETTAAAVEAVGGAQRGKAIIILNPVEPPLMMRNTVFCAIPAEAAEPGDLQDRILESIHAMVRTVQEYVPGYHLRADPQFDGARDAWRGQARVFVPIEVKGRGDYLPDYAGNLDIITAAAARVGDLLVAHRLGIASSWKSAADLEDDLGDLAEPTVEPAVTRAGV